jgi:hypothetical protein
MKHTAMDWVIEARTSLYMHRSALRNLMRLFREHHHPEMAGAVESVLRDSDLNLAVLDDIKLRVESLP